MVFSAEVRKVFIEYKATAIEESRDFDIFQLFLYRVFYRWNKALDLFANFFELLQME